MRRLCPAEALPEGAARSFDNPSDPEGYGVVVVRRDGALRAYRNRCPHTGVPLEWLPDVFLDPEGEHLQCATHAALFRIGDGHCIAGPCAGRGLQPLPVEERDGWVVMGECVSA